MEQKLAEFRARRRAGNSAREDERVGPQCRDPTAADTAAPTDAAPTADRRQTEEETDNSRDSPQRKVRGV